MTSPVVSFIALCRMALVWHHILGRKRSAVIWTKCSVLLVTSPLGMSYYVNRLAAASFLSVTPLPLLMGALLGASHHSSLLSRTKWWSYNSRQPFLDRRPPPWRAYSRRLQTPPAMSPVSFHPQGIIIDYCSVQLTTDSCWQPSYPITLQHSSPSLNHDDSNKKGLTLLAIDEVHLFAQFGVYFQDEFLQLCPLVFDKLRIGGRPPS